MKYDEDHYTKFPPSLDENPEVWDPSIPPAERLSICLRFLATGDSFRTIAFSFRVGVSTVSQIIPQVATAIWDCLVDDFMAVPSLGDWRSIAEEFQERWHFPLCCGALDGKHVQTKAPPNSGSMFHNYKGTFSIVLLAVVDARYRFRDIDVGGYGRTSDGGILANSTFGQALRAGTLHLPPDQPLPGGEHRGAQPHVFVADEAFPLRRELMRPFPGRLLPLEKRKFNYRLSRARMIVEGAFGVLSSQWRMYRCSMELHPEIAEKCVKATCVLHNFLRGLDERGAPAVRSVAPAVVEPLQSLGRVAANNSSREAVLVREKFMAHFSAEGAVTWQPKE
ncbi:protein ANTAGONIST OF LIKE HETEROCHROMATIN PROTEIN 1-like [Oreochromis aureus]|nr:protein ANTAGONIST OF LIKE HETEROCHROMATIN PROTEIN 1-like [Oreochromis aureus]